MDKIHMAEVRAMQEANYLGVFDSSSSESDESWDDDLEEDYKKSPLDERAARQL